MGEMTTAMKRVLVADGNGGRGRRLADALEVAGYECTVASHGADGLEIALAEPPQVVVAQTDLPLVDAVKLSEILRANPRTRSARFLFLGYDQPEGLPGQFGDAALPSQAETARIVQAVAALAERQARIERLEERARIELEFEGDLLELSLPELLQMLHLRAANGRLEFDTEGHSGARTTGRIWIREGEISAAEVGHVRAEKALFRMLDWRSGHFRFEPEDVGSRSEISAPTRSVLAEGLRQQAEWNRLAPKLPPLESPVKARIDRAELPHMVHPLTQEVLQLLDRFDLVADVVDHCGFPDYQVLRTLHTLGERGIVEFGRAQIAPAPAATRVLFNEAQCRRLRSFCQNGIARDAGVPDAKLMVVASSPDGLRQFADLLGKVPAAELSPRFARGEVGLHDLEALARIDVDGDFAIDLVNLPTGESFEPFWRMAGHRSLGTIFLLESRVGPCAERMAPIQAALAELPGARTFHVVMLSEAERLSPDELRENLDLLDEASLFLLPIDSSKDPGSLIHSLFARIVP